MKYYQVDVRATHSSSVHLILKQAHNIVCYGMVWLWLKQITSGIFKSNGQENIYLKSSSSS